MMALRKVYPHFCGEARNRGRIVLGCGLPFCLLAVAGGSTYLFKQCLCGVL
jgi:hypothetical protein